MATTNDAETDAQESVRPIRGRSGDEGVAEPVRIAAQQQHEEKYDIALPKAYHWVGIRRAFVNGILEEVGLHSQFRPGEGRTLDHRPPSAEETGALLVFPDETRVFVGMDDTAHTRGDYGFVVQPNDPVPLPTTVEEALNLLKPTGVRAQMDDSDDLPQRQGEWWLLETDRDPESVELSGGVSERPFNGSPLENHVPTEFAFGVSDSAVLSWFEDEYPALVSEGDTVVDVFNRLHQSASIAAIDSVEALHDTPTYREVREAVDGVFVRGTLRHRENDHYMERIGDEWCLARTHDMTVYTVGSISSRVQRD